MNTETPHVRLAPSYKRLIAIALISIAMQIATIDATDAATQRVRHRSNASDSISLTEYRTTLAIDLKVSQSRVLKLQNRITQTSISDPFIAEPVVVCEHDVVLVGKTPGRATLFLKDEAGNRIGILLRIHKNRNAVSSMLHSLSEAMARRLSGRVLVTALQPVTLKGSPNDAQQTNPPVEIETESSDHSTERERGTVSPSRDLDDWKNCIEVCPTSKVNDTRLSSCQPTMVMNLGIARARLFHVDCSLEKISIDDSKIATTVVLPPANSNLEFAGENPGSSIVRFRDRRKRTLAIQLNVSSERDDSLKALLTALCEGLYILDRQHDTRIPPALNGRIELGEYKLGKTIRLSRLGKRELTAPGRIVRIHVTDPAIAELAPLPHLVALQAKSPGTTTLFVWDDQGHVAGHKVVVSPGSSTPGSAALSDSTSRLAGAHADKSAQFVDAEIEYWTGSKKDVLLYELPPEPDAI